MGDHRCAGCQRGSRRRCRRAHVPELADDTQQSLAVDGAAVALLLRLGDRDQRPVLPGVFDREPPLCPRPRPDRHRLALHRALGRGPSALSTSDRGSCEALQRAAEARISFRDLRAAAPGRANGFRDVAMAGLDHPGLGRLFRRSPVGEDHPLHRRVASGRLRPHSRLRGDHQRFLESPALDDYRAVSHQSGGFQ